MFKNTAHYVDEEQMFCAISNIENCVKIIIQQVHSIQRHSYVEKTKKNSDGIITRYWELAKRPSKDFDIATSICDIRTASDSIKESIRLLKRYRNNNNSREEILDNLWLERAKRKQAESLLRYIRSIYGNDVFNHIKKEYERERGCRHD